MKQLFLLLTLVVCATAIRAQNIYGITHTIDRSGGFSSYGYHDNTITPIPQQVGCAVAWGSDERTVVYYISPCLATDVRLNGVDIVTGARTSVKMDRMLALTEFNDGTIWGIDAEEECLYRCDIATGKVTFYDSLFKTIGGREPEGKHLFHGSSFNPSKNIYYFTMTQADGSGFWDSTVFCQYDIASKTLTRQRLPSQFFNFKYSATSDRAFFASTPRRWRSGGWVPEKAPGFYEYDINNDSLQLIFEDWSFNSKQPLLLDKVNNRVYFFYAGNGLPNGCTVAYFGSYRFYSRRFDTYNASGKLCFFESGVFLPTYNDTTWDGFPLHVPDVADNTTALQVYPNPASNAVQVSYPGNGTLQVSNMQGAVVYRTTFSNSTSIDTRQWPAGIYLVRLTDGNGYSVAQKIVRE